MRIRLIGSDCRVDLLLNGCDWVKKDITVQSGKLIFPEDRLDSLVSSLVMVGTTSTVLLDEDMTTTWPSLLDGLTNWYHWHHGDLISMIIFERLIKNQYGKGSFPPYKLWDFMYNDSVISKNWRSAQWPTSRSEMGTQGLNCDAWQLFNSSQHYCL